MTISKGSAWGSVVARPHDLVVVPDDASLCEALVRRDGPVAPAAGDLHRTVGGRNIDGLSEVLALPIDLLDVTIDGGEFRACAHVQLRRPRWRGGWWFGPVLMVMNAEFIGPWHIAERGHPNDGRAEFCGWTDGFGFRDRVLLGVVIDRGVIGTQRVDIARSQPGLQRIAVALAAQWRDQAAVGVEVADVDVA